MDVGEYPQFSGPILTGLNLLSIHFSTYLLTVLSHVLQLLLGHSLIFSTHSSFLISSRIYYCLFGSIF